MMNYSYKISAILAAAILSISSMIVLPQMQQLQATHLLPSSGTGAIIGNSAVLVGVDYAGQLNVPYREVPALGLPAGDPAGVFYLGLRDGTGVYASTEPGCLCEGWGIGSPDIGVSGFANNAAGTSNVDVISFTGTDGGSSAISKVTVKDAIGNPVFNVTHDYHPSADTPYLFEVVVTVENVGTVDLNSTLYRRVMDWDVYPTPFAEFVTIQGTATTTKLVHSGDNGFASSDPLSVTDYDLFRFYGGPDTTDIDFEDFGIADHGAVFDFEIGPIKAGESTQLKTFYGAAPNEAAAEAALSAIQAELYSLGQSTIWNGTANVPDNDGVQGPTFMFAFSGVGGTPVIPPANTPGKITAGGAQIEKGINFGFNIQSNGTAVKGQLQYMDKTGTTKINLHSTEMTTLAVSTDGLSGNFSGIATVNGAPGFVFKVSVEDNGEPGTADKFTIEIPDLSYTKSGILTKGNIQIHEQ